LGSDVSFLGSLELKTYLIVLLKNNSSASFCGFILFVLLSFLFHGIRIFNFETKISSKLWGKLYNNAKTNCWGSEFDGVDGLTSND